MDAPKQSRTRPATLRTNSNYIPRQLNFDDVTTNPKMFEQIELLQIVLPPHEYKQENKRPRIEEKAPLSFPLSFKPFNLLNVGLCLEELVIEPTDIGKFEINKERVKQQLNYWNLLERPNLFTINSLLTATAFEAPYKLFDYKDELPMIGIYKRAGKLRGENIWITLPEAQILVKLFVYLLNHKAAELNGQPQTQFKLKMNFDQITYSGHDFANLGVPRDRFYGDGVELPNLDELTQILQKQLQFTIPKGDSSYPVGSVDLLTCTLERRPLYGLLKKTGMDAGQRLWFSVYELEYLVFDLVDRLCRAYATLTK
jgi:hypothetical protein